MCVLGNWWEQSSVVNGSDGRVLRVWQICCGKSGPGVWVVLGYLCLGVSPGRESGSVLQLPKGLSPPAVSVLHSAALPWQKCQHCTWLFWFVFIMRNHLALGNEIRCLILSGCHNISKWRSGNWQYNLWCNEKSWTKGCDHCQGKDWPSDCLCSLRAGFCHVWCCCCSSHSIIPTIIPPQLL